MKGFRESERKIPKLKASEKTPKREQLKIAIPESLQKSNKVLGRLETISENGKSLKISWTVKHRSTEFIHSSKLICPDPKKRTSEEKNTENAQLKHFRFPSFILLFLASLFDIFT